MQKREFPGLIRTGKDGNGEGQEKLFRYCPLLSVVVRLKAAKLLFTTILALFMLAGCVQTVTLVVFNNSGKDVCITALGEKFDLKCQTAIKILTASESIHSLQVADSAGNSYTASFTTPLDGTLHHNIYLQLEKDMKIYRVGNDKFPQHPIPTPSEGFPVVLSGGKK